MTGKPMTDELTTPEMIERVACAIEEAVGTSGNFLVAHMTAKRAARAAITAINSSRPNPEGQVTEALVERLWLATKHGDEDHQTWLREAYTAFFSCQPVPIPRGSGNKEKRIAELEAQLASNTVAPETTPIEGMSGANS